jgi:hypothetical protein
MIRRGTWGVWAWVLLGAGALALSMGMPLPKAGVPGPDRPLPPPTASYRRYAVDSLAHLTVARDVFRSARRPSSVAYDPQRAVAPVESNQPPKPALALVGIVAGPEPTAVIEGLPGVDGARVMRVGDLVSGVRVMRIASDHVRLAGMDTVWVLRVREPWK